MALYDKLILLIMTEYIWVWQLSIFDVYGTADTFSEGSNTNASNSKNRIACLGTSFLVFSPFQNVLDDVNVTGDFFFYKEKDSGESIDFKHHYIVFWSSVNDTTDIRNERFTLAVGKPYILKIFPIQSEDTGSYVQTFIPKDKRQPTQTHEFDITVQSSPQLQSPRLNFELIDDGGPTELACGKIRSFGNPQIELIIRSANKNNTAVDTSVDVGFLQSADRSLFEAGNTVTCEVAKSSPNYCISSENEDSWKVSIVFGEMEFAQTPDTIKRPLVFAAFGLTLTLIALVIAAAVAKKSRKSTSGSDSRTIANGLPSSLMSNHGGSTQDAISDVSDHPIMVTVHGSSTSL